MCECILLYLIFVLFALGISYNEISKLRAYNRATSLFQENGEPKSPADMRAINVILQWDSLRRQIDGKKDELPVGIAIHGIPRLYAENAQRLQQSGFVVREWGDGIRQPVIAMNTEKDGL